MGMRENWHRYIDITKSKCKGHEKAAQYWDFMHSFLSLLVIFLGATTTFLSLIDSVPSPVVSGIAALTTLSSAVAAFLRPHDRRLAQVESAKEFRILMMRMVRCEHESEYEDLWRELNKALMDEPFLPKKYIANAMEMNWSITPELLMIIVEKENELVEAIGDEATKLMEEERQTREDEKIQFAEAENRHQNGNVMIDAAADAVTSIFSQFKDKRVDLNSSVNFFGKLIPHDTFGAVTNGDKQESGFEMKENKVLVVNPDDCSHNDDANINDDISDGSESNDIGNENDKLLPENSENNEVVLKNDECENRSSGSASSFPRDEMSTDEKVKLIPQE
eukprot:TCONS_00011911-protein